MEYGLAHAIALFAEDVMLQSSDPDYPLWRRILVDVIGFMVSAAEQNEHFCSICITLPPIIRFLCSFENEQAHPDPILATRAVRIACDMFQLSQPVSPSGYRMPVGLESMQTSFDDMQRNAKAGRLVEWLYGHHQPIDFGLLRRPVRRARNVGRSGLDLAQAGDAQ